MKNILFVKIHKALAKKKTIKTATSRAWKIKKEIGDSLDYVIGMNHNEIAGIFKVLSGKIDSSEGRYEFELEESEDLKINKKIEQHILKAPKPMCWVVKLGKISV